MDTTPRPTTTAVISATTPPPLPTPGTGGREELPTPSPEQCETRPGSEELRRFAAAMAFFVVIWAISGAGHFWPIWVFLGWGMKLLATGSIPHRPWSSGPHRA